MGGMGFGQRCQRIRACTQGVSSMTMRTHDSFGVCAVVQAFTSTRYRTIYLSSFILAVADGTRLRLRRFELFSSAAAAKNQRCERIECAKLKIGWTGMVFHVLCDLSEIQECNHPSNDIHSFKLPLY